MLIAGRYRLHAPIGRGAMGEVWRAYDEVLGRPVAVKLLLGQESDSTAASRFRLEAQTAGRLNHPHVVGVLDFGEHENRLFLVMELVEGDSLAHALSPSGALPPAQAARIAAQAAAGLAAAHQQGIVHRDIKPANLLLDADGTLKIGDFGIARFLDDPAAALTATGQIVGTSLYLAPERALGKAASPASDIYSLGCVLYHLATGRPPFHADTAVAILHQHLDAPPVPPRDLGIHLPPAFENYLLGLLAKRPEDRPTAQQAADWFASNAWQGHPEPLPPTAPAPQPQALHPAEPTPAAPSARHRAADESRAPTYMLPSTTGHTGRVHGGSGQRPSIRGLAGRRKGLTGAVAGVLIFLAAMLAGMAWFAPDNSSAETTGPDPTRTAGPPPASTPPAERSASPLPSASVLTDEEDHEDTVDTGGEEATKREERRQKQEEEREREAERKHRDEDD
ncbi:serine/threonine-protein kinase [Streptomyces tailanensis]|uniref:serine/threonine-protein kinase n=1 Tax=Streptomyces tailanensis TaxID=2569858 RepID=UPI00155AFF72|nr:serine/threonine-protein kinase [Streptomyces tailanensis]